MGDTAVGARPPSSYVDYALEGVRRELVTGALKPGEKIAVEALAKRLGISHIPVREALRYLEAEGQIVRDQRRLRVAVLSLQEAEDIYHTRELLEREAIALGLPRLTKHDKAALTTLVAAMETAAAAGDQAAYHSLTRRFHFIPFERAERPWMLRFLRVLWDASARYQRPLYQSGTWRGGHLGHHRDLLDAAIDGDVPRVNELMSHHRQWLIAAARWSAASLGESG